MVELEETRPDTSNTLIFKDLVHYLERELSKVGTSPVRRRDIMINLSSNKNRNGAWVVLLISAL
ncbi:MAG: hypothetical protein CM1200mP14_10420 [Gammaproteobacteria bacterium]|nr:MAG: hypothetical protein CM1200mP14_10420 [Gammaproteobacteria bacterium]